MPFQIIIDVTPIESDPEHGQVDQGFRTMLKQDPSNIAGPDMTINILEQVSRWLKNMQSAKALIDLQNELKMRGIIAGRG